MYYNFKILNSFTLTILFWIIFHICFYAFFLHYNSFDFCVSVLPYTLLVFFIGLLFIYFMINNIKILKKIDLEKSKFEFIFNSSVDALFIVDKTKLLIIDCNKRAVELFEANQKADLIGFDGTKLHFEPLSESERIEIKYKNDKEQNLDYEFQYITFKNKIFWGHLISTPILIENKICNLVRISDISSRKSTELKLISANEDLKIANEELDSFVYRASHDLRSPLTSILGLLNVTVVENTDSNAIKYVPLMQQSVQKLLHVIDDLILYSRNSRIEIKPENINFKEIINTQISNLNHLINANKITFNIHINPTEIAFKSDVLRIYILFSNLISNAIKYHDSSKINQFINIDINYNDIEANIVISDNGSGIPSDHISKIFNMFYRANITSTGSGLGLYIVKGVIEKLGGKIEVESVYKQSTTFKILIPNITHIVNE